MKLHSSHFRIVGFTEEVEPRELGELGPEPRVRDAVASGVDVVTFSGDKLLGGPQAGLIVGRRECVRALRANPIYRLHIELE